MSLSTHFITLGTAGGPVPKLHRAQPAHALTRGNQVILIDCGEGAMQQLMRAGIDFRRVDKIILSHHHFDHIGSLFTCLGINMMLQRSQPIKIYGPPGTRKIAEGLAMACDVPHAVGFGISGQTFPHPRNFVQVEEISSGKSFEIDGIRISCCENTHYRSEDKFGTDGPISLSLRFDAPDRSIVYTGDTGPCRMVENLAQGAQLLVGEMMIAEKVITQLQSKNPHMTPERVSFISDHLNKHHLSPEQLGELASRAGVEHVVAVHIPLDSITPENTPDYVAQISQRFSGKVTIAEDLDQF
ncbi:MAG: MBL fold metallo-hydrolase [Planktomarina sp.]|nr:MBL fold metallo-hydrolase [Planktomarina sp.]MDT2039729.1 MBL fold metallo-hydrolase [Planktomarina sp.]|tara:strand:- start:14085 stop:14981 length:897 start_codon:yes stop_codon:yes gene_type:complete